MRAAPSQCHAENGSGSGSSYWSATWQSRARWNAAMAPLTSPAERLTRLRGFQRRYQHVGRGVAAELVGRGRCGLADALEVHGREVGIALLEVCAALSEIPEPALDCRIRPLRYQEHFIEAA